MLYLLTKLSVILDSCEPGGGLYLELDEVCHVHGHLVNLSVIKLLYVFQCTFIVSCDEVNGYSFAAEASAAANPSERGREREKLYITLTPTCMYLNTTYVHMCMNLFTMGPGKPVFPGQQLFQAYY